MTQIVNPIGPAAANPPASSVGDSTGAPPTTTAPSTAIPPPPRDPADLRLVIEDDQAAGCFVYKTVDWRTGEVVQQIPREQILKLREAPAYLAGDVIKTKV
jgi:flagellar protein FlaG